MTDRYYTDADAAFDNEQAGGCPLHGLNHPECTCCRECGWRKGAHAHGCELWSPDPVMLSDTPAWREVAKRARVMALEEAELRDDCDCQPTVVDSDERTYRRLGFVHVDVRYCGAGYLALYEYRQRDDSICLAQD